MARILFAIGVIAALVAVDWPWRNRSLQIVAPILRFFLALTVALWLFMSTSLTPAYRHALVASDRVTTMWGRELSPYSSGVLTMERDATHLLRRVIPPLLILTWLSTLPAARGVGRAVRLGRNAEGPSPSASAPVHAA